MQVLSRLRFRDSLPEEVSAHSDRKLYYSARRDGKEGAVNAVVGQGQALPLQLGGPDRL